MNLSIHASLVRASTFRKLVTQLSSSYLLDYYHSNIIQVLAEAAVPLKCLPAVSSYIDEFLGNQGQALWQSVAFMPLPWVELARYIKSTTIFKDAIIHLVGKWDTLSQDTRDELPAYIFEICETKHKDFMIYKRAVEYAMMVRSKLHLHYLKS